MLLLATARKKKAGELVRSMTEIMADNKRKIQSAHAIIASGKLPASSSVHSMRHTVRQENIHVPEAIEMQLQHLYKDLEAQKEQFVQAKTELEEFVFAASHDLQEPLRMVTCFLTQLKKKYYDNIDDTGKEYINRAVTGAKKMRQIILDLQELSFLSRMEYGEEAVDLSVTMAGIEALYSKEIGRTGAKIVYDSLPVIITRESIIRRIFENLIGNALKFSKPGVPVEVKITVTSIPGFWQFEVSDNGVGIAQEDFNKIFVVFQTLQAKKAISGSGMGLSITKKIVEKLGGKIWVESKEGEGSRFYFTVPYREAFAVAG